MYLSRIDSFIRANKNNNDLDVSISSLEKSIQTVMSMGCQLKKEMETVLGVTRNVPGRNDKVVVRDLIHGRELTGKFKLFEREVESGFYEIIEVIN